MREDDIADTSPIIRRQLLKQVGASLAGGLPVAAMAADVASPVGSLSRADLSGAPDAGLGSALLTAKSALRGAVARTQHSKNADFVSAFDFMTQSKIDAVTSGAGADVTEELQVAISASPFVWFPPGTYRLSRKLILRTDSCLQGAAPHAVNILGVAGQPILEFPYLSVDCVVRCLQFSGDGATAIAVAKADGPFRGYLARPIIVDCHFEWNLDVGIDADLIYARIARCTFGFHGRGANARRMIGIRSAAVGTNYTNLNSVRYCIFKTGGATSAACELAAGVAWEFVGCDWSYGGMAVRTNNIQVLKFDLCWFEGNTTQGAVIQVVASDNFVDFTHCVFQNNNAPRLIQWSSKAVRGLHVENCTFALHQTSLPVYDDSAEGGRPTSAGTLIWRRNAVNGGHPSNTLTSGVSTGDSSQPRGWAVVNTNGSVVASSDPGLRVRRNGIGDASLMLTNAAASLPARICAICTAQASGARALGQDNPYTIRIRCVDDAGRAVDDTVNVTWFGV